MAVGQQGGGLLSAAALLDVEDVCPQLVEPHRDHAVDDDLPGQRRGELGQRGGVAGERDGDDHQVRRARDVHVGTALDRDLGPVGGGGGTARDLGGHL